MALKSAGDGCGAVSVLTDICRELGDVGPSSSESTAGVRWHRRVPEMMTLSPESASVLDGLCGFASVADADDYLVSHPFVAGSSDYGSALTLV